MSKKVLIWLAYGFKTFVLRKELPYLFGMVITDRCNLNCFYCESENSGRYHFPFEEAKLALCAAYNRGHRSLYFTGGEPMIWEDDGHKLDELVRFACDIGFLEVFIATNGTVPLTIKQCVYVVTIDGPKAIHDKIRNGSYDLVLSNVSSAATKAVFATITFSKANASYLDQFVKEVSATNLFRGISFNLLTHWPEIVEEQGLPPDERRQLVDRVWELKKSGYPIVLSRAAYRAFRNNDWKRPIQQIELGTKERIFKCCRDVEHPAICKNCGYSTCVEVSQILEFKPSAMWQAVHMVGV